MYDRILVPTDGSVYAEAAAERALELAGTVDAEVFAISVVETGPFGSVRLPGDSASAEEAFTERAETFVARIAERARDRGVDVTTEVREGIAVQEILECVAEIDADLVVMGTRGRGGVGQLLLGSVTEDVTRHGDVDVLVVDADGDT